MRKSVIVIALVIVAAIAYILFQAQFFALIQTNPATADIYREIAGRTLIGLFYISVFGALFFIFFPAEVTFVYYTVLGYDPILVALIAVVGNTIGMIFNYWFGRILGKWLMEKYLKKKYDNWSKWLDKWGTSLIVFGNATPFPIEPASLVIGSLRYPFGKFIKWTVVGRMLKYIIVWLVFVYASKLLLPIITTYLPLNAAII